MANLLLMPAAPELPPVAPETPGHSHTIPPLNWVLELLENKFLYYKDGFDDLAFYLEEVEAMMPKPTEGLKQAFMVWWK